jgi:hypothetical protein
MNDNQKPDKGQAGRHTAANDLKQTLLDFGNVDSECPAEAPAKSSEAAVTPNMAKQSIPISEAVKVKNVKTIYIKLESAECEVVPPPGGDDFSNRQLTLFQGFLCNTAEEKQRLSNTIELWDSVPRYSVGLRQQSMLRDEKTGTLPNYAMVFNYRGETFKAVIQPARINLIDDSGKPMFDERGMPRSADFYPSNREELVEDALRKLASRQSYGFVQQHPKETSGVAFSLNELCQELAARGHTFSYKQANHSLMILNRSHIFIYRECDEKDKAEWMGATYLPVLAAVSRKRIQAEPSSKWVVHFHPFVTQGIATLAYRQFNYEKMMSLSNQLSRWLHKYLCMTFTFAGLTAPPFEIYYKTIKRDSGLLKQKNERRNFFDVEEAMKELIVKNVLADWKKTETVGARGKKIDAVYHLTPSTEFIREVKAANKRRADIAARALCGKFPAK